MAGFALLGKNLINSAPILAGGWLYALYKREPFAKYVYLTMFGTCLAPMVSFLLLFIRIPPSVPHLFIAWAEITSDSRA